MVHNCQKGSNAEASKQVKGRTIAVFLAQLFTAVFASRADAESALEMKGYCQGVIEAQQTAGSNIVMPVTFETGLCWGAFSAFQTLGVVQFEDDYRSALRICLPPSSTRLQLVQVFHRYAEVRPERGHEDWAVIALDAFVEAFPCD